MRHRQSGKHLNRTPEHRIALLRNLTRALITHERIVTTVAKAKLLRPYVERIITMAKKAAVVAEQEGGNIKALHYRRLAMATLGPMHGTGIYDKNDDLVEGNNTLLKKLFNEIGPRFKDRPGGYTRIVKQHYRRLGDAGETAIIELLKSGETKVRLKQDRKTSAPAPVAPTTEG